MPPDEQSNAFAPHEVDPPPPELPPGGHVTLRLHGTGLTEFNWQLPLTPSEPQIWLKVSVSRSKCAWFSLEHQSHSAFTGTGQLLPQHDVYRGGAVPTHGQFGVRSGAFTKGPHS